MLYTNKTYYWSNGETGNTITVNEGGAYRVTAVLGNCSTSAQIDVPKNPENYLWVFPKGCFTDCDTNLNQLIGPSVTLSEWSWELDNQIQQAGSDSVPEDFFFGDPGSYTMSINNGGCTVTSEPLHYQVVSCDGCPISRILVNSVDSNNTTFCSYTIELQIISTSIVSYQVTLSDTFNNVIISPASFTLNPGSTTYTFTVIPMSPFTGGLMQWVLQGNIPNGENGYEQCLFDFPIEIPECTQNKPLASTSLEVLEAGLAELTHNQVKLYPNPAKEAVAVQYILNTTASIALFDLTGRQLAEHQTTTTSGEWNLNTASFPAGIYIVVVKQTNTNGHVEQHKLVIE